ncbi:MAG: alpha/beta hydrolase [Ferruginibacter sp.]
MKTIYLISGLGADERIFSRLKISGHKIVHLPWLTPLKNETIRDYAKRMSEHIKEPNPVIAGLSFGGMMSIEISKLVNPSKIILISSIPSFHQLPRWMRLAGLFKLNRILPMRSFRILQPIEDRNMGVETPEDKILVRHYRKTVDQVYLNWAINQVLNWKNDWQPPVVYHIHGTRDRIFPSAKLSPTHKIQGGGHFMVYNRAEEVSRLILEILNKD